MNTQPIASELSFYVLQKQQQERDTKEGRITAPVQAPAYPASRWAAQPVKG